MNRILLFDILCNCRFFAWYLKLIPLNTKSLDKISLLVLEYEEVLLRKQSTLPFNQKEIGQILDYLCSIAHLHEVHFLWRPILNDPKDDMILDLAVRATCEYIVTYNKRDFAGVNKFGIKAVTAQDFLKIIKVIP